MMIRRTTAVALLIFSIGCGGTTPPQLDPARNLSPTGHAAYDAMKVGKALDVLRDVAAAGERTNPKLVSPGFVLKVVAYHKQVVMTMDAIPGGWKSIALAGLDRLKENASAEEWAQLEPFATLLRSLINAFVSGGPMPDFGATLALDDVLLGGVR